jgi:hypothetical protein
VKRKILAPAGNCCYSLRPHIVTALTELSWLIQGKRPVIQSTDLVKATILTKKMFYSFPLTSKVAFLQND